MMGKNCQICKARDLKLLLNVGNMPVCSRFLDKPTPSEYCYRFKLELCDSCGMVQQTDPFPVEQLRAFNGMKYAEPEDHLDDVANILEKTLQNKNINGAIGGISYKDESLLQRMREKGFTGVLLSPREDWGIADNYEGVDRIQSTITAENAQKITSRRGKFSLIIARHLIEHSYNLWELLRGLRELITPEGYLVIEVPDYERPFLALDYSTLWEEHLLYFTPGLLKHIFPFFDFSLVNFYNYYTPVENCLVVVLRLAPHQPAISIPPVIIEEEKRRAHHFAAEFLKQKSRIHSFLSATPKRIVGYGAGHGACFLFNALRLQQIHSICDNNPQKVGKYLPGLQVPIVGQENLQPTDLCILGVNVATERAIIGNNQDFINQGGMFVSLNPESKWSIIPSPKVMEVTSEVLYNTQQVVVLAKEDLSSITKNASRSLKKRSRICVHKSSEDNLQEMMITLAKGSYIRPHKHEGKPESFHILEGEGCIIIFSEKGDIEEIIPLGGYTSGIPFFYRMDSSRYHMVYVLSEKLVFHETTIGPFDKSATVMAPWSPPEDNGPDQEKFLQKIAEAIGKFLHF